MTIASQLTSAQVPCNGTTTQFNFANKIFQASDLVVTLIDSLGNLYAFSNGGSGNTFSNGPSGLSYTVFNIDVDTGCYIVFTAAPTAGWTLDGRSSIPQIQSTSVKNQGPFNPELHEEFFDKATRMLQDLYRKAYAFSVHGPDLEATPWPTLPLPAQRANTNLGFDGLGRLTISAALAAATLSAASIGGFLYPVQPQEGTSVANIFYKYGWPERYGAGVATADNSTFLNNCFAAGYKVSGRGNVYPILNPIQNTLPFQIFEDVGVSVSTGFPINGTVWTSTAAASPGVMVRNPFIDGGLQAGGNACIAGALFDVQSSRFRMTNVIGRHFQNVGISFDSTLGGDTGINGYQLEQFNNTDPGWNTQGNRTADGFFFNRGDCFTIGGESSFVRYCATPFHFGSKATNIFCTALHPYNGNPGGAAPIHTDPLVAKIDEGALSINLIGGYWDSGHIDAWSTDLHISGGMPYQNNQACVFADPNWIRLYATGKGYPYDLDVDLPTAYLGTVGQNSPASALATSFVGFYPSAPIALTSLSAAAGAGVLTYIATSNLAPQANSTFFLNGVGTTAAFNGDTVATATAAGNVYQITTLGTTNWQAIGAKPGAIVGTVFTANGAGSGTGHCAFGYPITSASQTAGGAGVGVVTVNFATAITGTGTGGTFQRSWTGNFNGLDAASGLLGNGAHQRAHFNGGRFLGMTGSTMQADTIYAATPFFQVTMQCSDLFPTTYNYGNQAFTYPFVNCNTGFFAISAANNPGGGLYPRASLALNLNGTAVNDNGGSITAATMIFRTQGIDRLTLDGASAGTKALQSSVDGYLNLGNGSFRYNTVFATNGAINTCDEREKDLLADAPVPGSSYLRRLKVVPFKWKIGDKHIEPGQFVFAGTNAPAPDGYSPSENFEQQQAIIQQILKLPKNRKQLNEAQTAELDSLEAQLHTIAKLGQSIIRLPEVVTDLPGTRTHYTVTAQSVKAALDAEGISDHAGWTLADPKDDDSRQGIRENEAILMPTVVTVQEHIEKIAALEAKVAALIAKVGAA